MLNLSLLGATHVASSLAAIVASVAALVALLRAKHEFRWMSLAIALTTTTDVTAFLLPQKIFGFAAGLGVLSIASLVAVLALLQRAPAGRHRDVPLTFIVTSYINMLAGLTSAFQFVPWLRSYAEPLASAPLTFSAFWACFRSGVFAAVQGALIFVTVVIAFTVARRRRIELNAGRLRT